MNHLLNVFLIISSLFSQAKPNTTLNNSIIANFEMWTVFNRTMTIVQVEDKEAAYLDEKSVQGVAWLPSLEFSDGVIELDLKGRNDPGKS